MRTPRPRLPLVLLLPLTTFALAPSLAAQLATLAPVADATTDSSQPTVNFGSAPELDFGKAFTSSPTFSTWFTRGHVLFDVSAYTGFVPTRATFFWYQRTSSAAGCLDVSLHNVLAPWTESGVTWQNQPAFAASEVSRTCVGNSFDLGWKEFDVTALAQQWLSGAIVNHGFVIRDPQESSAGAARPGLGHSREFATASLQPYLELDFATTLGTGCSTHATVPALDVAGGAAIMGSTLDLRTSNLLPGSIAAMFFGLDDTTYQGLPLPLSLAPLGTPGCFLEIDALVGVTLGVATTSPVILPLQVPIAPAFDGLPLFAQTFVFTPSGAFEATNGLSFRLWL